MEQAASNRKSELHSRNGIRLIFKLIPETLVLDAVIGTIKPHNARKVKILHDLQSFRQVGLPIFSITRRMGTSAFPGHRNP
jgi:hypothetical protein